jgi:hypothetical protein
MQLRKTKNAIQRLFDKRDSHGIDFDEGERWQPKEAPWPIKAAKAVVLRVRVHNYTE